MADQEAAPDENKEAPPETPKADETKDASPEEGAKSASPTKSRQSKSPKGRPDSKASGRASSRAKSPKSGRTTKAEKKKDELKVDESTKEETTPEPVALPENAEAIFLASKTQEIFACQTDVDVTEDNPFKLLKKEDIIADMRTRAAVSDFSPRKAIIQDYPADEILIVYDPDFRYGQNFYIALTEEAKEYLLNPPSAEEGDGTARGEDAEPVVYKYVPPVAKEWVSQGSGKEIREETLKYNRSKISMSVKRLRRHFGGAVTFTDRNVADAKDGYIECASYEDSSFNMSRMEKDTGIQAIPDFNDTGTQTDWKYPRNAYTQYTPRLFDEKQKQDLLNQTDLQKFILASEPRFELALQQNGIMDVFFNDWENLGDEDTAFGGKSDNHLKEYQSFTDLKFSKRKTVTSIDWHPTIKGLIGVSCAERMTFDERIENSGKILMNPSLILIWSFVDPINPMLLLEAPDDILCFRFCPTDPNIIAGGCINGQVVMWDVSAHAERLKAQRTNREIKKDSLNSLPGFDDGSGLDTPIVRYCAVSSIENSHKSAITDLQWIPDHYELNRMGVPQENRSQQCSQIMTCATDHCILLWDIKAPKTSQNESKKDEIKNATGVSTMFKHLDLTWKPILKVYLTRSEPGGDHSPIKFSFQEKQGDRSVLGKASDPKIEREPSNAGFNFAKPASGKEKRTLTEVTSKMYIGGEDGEIIYADWMPQKDQDSGKVMTPKPVFYNSCHDGPIVSLQRSPFFKDIILVVGGWSFTIWKEGVNSGPVLATSAQTKKLTAGFWSPSRPGVIYIAREDGNIEIWDFLDRTHEASQTQNVSANPITCIFPYALTNKQHLLAVGDTSGTLHILEIPWSLRHPTPNEMNGITNYFEREVKRRSFVMTRWDFREAEKRQLEADAKLRAGIAPQVQLTDEEIEYKMKQEYNAYLEEELSFLRELGLAKEEEEVLPEV